MPNWCLNEVIVTGAASDVDRFVELAASHQTKFSLPDLVPVNTDTDPSTIWGTSAVDCEERAVYDIAATRVARYLFESAWAPPSAAVMEMSRSWPDLTFLLSCYEGGNDFADVTKTRDGDQDYTWTPNCTHFVTMLLVGEDRELYRTSDGRLVERTNDALLGELSQRHSDPQIVLVEAGTGDLIDAQGLPIRGLTDLAPAGPSLELLPVSRLLWMLKHWSDQNIGWEVHYSHEWVLEAADEARNQGRLTAEEAVRLFALGAVAGESFDDRGVAELLNAGVDPDAAIRFLIALIDSRTPTSGDDVLHILHGALRQH